MQCLKKHQLRSVSSTASRVLDKGDMCSILCSHTHRMMVEVRKACSSCTLVCKKSQSFDLFLCVFLFSIPPHPAAHWRWSQHTLASLCSVIYMSISEPEVPYFVPSLLLVLYFVCGVFKSVCVCSLRETAYVLVGQLKKKPSPTWTLCLSAHRVPRLILRTVYSSTPLSPLVCDRYSAVRGESVTGFPRTWCGFKHSTSDSFPLIFPLDILTMSQPSCKNNLHINVSENFCNCAHTHMKVYVSLTVTSALFFNPFLIS